MVGHGYCRGTDPGTVFKQTLTSIVRELSARAGYPIIAQWRLDNWERASHLRALFALLDIDCVIDVGANIGQFREFLRLQVGYRGRVVSLEPVGELFERLRAATTADRLWSVHALALGDTDGRSAINVTRERTLSSLLPPDEEHLRAMGYQKYLYETQVERTEPITVRRLDSIIDDLVCGSTRRIFLKSDTQGYDMHAIRGARGCFDRLPAIQVELPVREVYRGTPDYLTSLAELASYGYELTGLFSVQRDSTLRLITVDAVLIRRAEAERLRAAARTAPGHRDRP